MDISIKEKNISKKIFEHFDNCISINENINEKIKTSSNKIVVNKSTTKQINTAVKTDENDNSQYYKISCLSELQLKNDFYNYIQSNIDQILFEIINEDFY